MAPTKLLQLPNLVIPVTQSNYSGYMLQLPPLPIIAAGILGPDLVKEVGGIALHLWNVRLLKSNLYFVQLEHDNSVHKWLTVSWEK